MLGRLLLVVGTGQLLDLFLVLHSSLVLVGEHLLGPFLCQLEQGEFGLVALLLPQLVLPSLLLLILNLLLKSLLVLVLLPP